MCTFSSFTFSTWLLFSPRMALVVPCWSHLDWYSNLLSLFPEESKEISKWWNLLASYMGFPQQFWPHTWKLSSESSERFSCGCTGDLLFDIFYIFALKGLDNLWALRFVQAIEELRKILSHSKSSLLSEVFSSSFEIYCGYALATVCYLTVFVTWRDGCHVHSLSFLSLHSGLGNPSDVRFEVFMIPFLCNCVDKDEDEKVWSLLQAVKLGCIWVKLPLFYLATHLFMSSD